MFFCCHYSSSILTLIFSTLGPRPIFSVAENSFDQIQNSFYVSIIKLFLKELFVSQITKLLAAKEKNVTRHFHYFKCHFNYLKWFNSTIFSPNFLVKLHLLVSPTRRRSLKNFFGRNSLSSFLFLSFLSLLWIDVNQNKIQSQENVDQSPEAKNVQRFSPILIRKRSEIFFNHLESVRLWG